MNINLKSLFVPNFSLSSTIDSNNDIYSDLSLSLKFKTIKLKNKPTGFIVQFKVSVKNKANNFLIKLLADAVFETDGEVDDKFLVSPFSKINAPAIAFPYLRAYIAQATLQSGFPPLHLPSYNFVAIAQIKDKKRK